MPVIIYFPMEKKKAYIYYFVFYVQKISMKRKLNTLKQREVFMLKDNFYCIISWN